LNYLLKYVSSDKADFQDIKSQAQYMVCTRKSRLLTTFGCFFNIEIIKTKCICKKCNQQIQYRFNHQEVYELMFSPVPKPPQIEEDIIPEDKLR